MSDRVLSRRDFLKTTLASTVGTLGAGLAFYGYGHEIESRWIDIERVDLTLPRLTPAFDGYRMVHISDIHKDYWMSDAQLEWIIRLVNEQDPDLVVITGDFVSNEYLTTDKVIEVLTTELSRIQARDGMLGVLGNHDHWTGADLVRDILRQSNVLELENEVHTLRRGDEVLHFAGMGDIIEGLDRLDLVVKRLPVEGPAILMVHEPYEFEIAAATGRFDVQLSGHTHGGQVSIPFVGRPWKQYSAGIYRSGTATLYLNRGLGIMMPLMRIGSRPEIAVLTLKTSVLRPKK